MDRQFQIMITVPSGSRETKQEMKTTSTPMVSNADLEREVTDMIHEIGVPAHIKGYQYLREAIIDVSENMDMLESITKILYPTIAKISDNGKQSGTCHQTCDRGGVEPWKDGNTWMPCLVIPSVLGKGKPTNSEFIALIADKIRLLYHKRLKNSF